MSGLGSAAAYAFALAAVGFLWALALSGRRRTFSFWMAVAASYPLGALALSWTWLVLMLAGARLGSTLIVITAAGHAILAGICAGLRRARFGLRAERAPGEWKLFEWSALLAVAALAAVQGHALLKTPYHGDGLGFWRPKARVVAAEGTVRTPFFTHPAVMHTNRRYPLLVPLVQAGLLVLDDRVSEEGERLTYAAFFVSLVLLAYTGLRRTCSPRGALVLLLILITASGGRLGSGYNTAPISAYLLGGLVFLLLAFEDDRPGAWMPAALFAAGMIFTKTEGLLYVVLMAACVAIASVLGRSPRNLARLALLIAATGLISLPWLIFRHGLPRTYVLDIASFFTLDQLRASLPKAPYVAMLFGLEVFSFRSWGPFWFLVVWAAFSGRSPLVLRAFPVAALVIWLAVALLHPVELSWNLYTGDRFLYQMAMPSLLLMGYGLARASTREPGGCGIPDR